MRLTNNPSIHLSTRLNDHSNMLSSNEKVELALQVNKNSVASGFDKAAANYNQQALIQGQIANYGLTLFEKAYQFTQAHNDVNNKVLDLGCGTALSLKRLGAISKQVIALDLSLSMLRQGQKQSIQAERMPSATHKECTTYFLNADIENLPIASESMDGIYSSMAMQWCSSPLQVLSEISRVLKPNGHVVLGVLNGQSFASLHNAWRSMNVNSRLNEFHSHAAWVTAAKEFTWQVDAHSQSFTSWHRNVLDMLRSIKNIGANTHVTYKASCNLTDSATPFMSKREIKQLTQNCEALKHAKTGLLGLDYQVSFLSLKKT